MPSRLKAAPMYSAHTGCGSDPVSIEDWRTDALVLVPVEFVAAENINDLDGETVLHPGAKPSKEVVGPVLPRLVTAQFALFRTGLRYEIAGMLDELVPVIVSK